MTEQTGRTEHAPRILSEEEWTARRTQHRERVARLVDPHAERRASGTAHPVHDFLFTYYSFRPNQLRRWHPGHGIALADAEERADWAGYHAVDVGDVRVVTVRPDVLEQRHETVRFVADLLAATESRPAALGCLGLHEWAMVYRAGDDVRHRTVPLRLGAAGTDAVVESLPLRCTHYDAFRFFTDEAAPRNSLTLSRADQVDREQPGCLHAGMDLYKWAYKLVPLVDSDLVLDCLEHAFAARELDMRASPYDLTDYGYSPVPIETAAGRADYVRHQADLAERARPLRARLRHLCEQLLAYPT
ncbi:3-methyladenine DNA glycosylase [Rhodococcus triatomae]|nr:3-methyladenine DNA glycosylase [Rhodococcus triatomae]QNG25248.1 3-methyladenine DNA glycosylase [Rhodococcus triatomae]